ncbi:hypothetical protein Lal_00030480 [Lupinus albus]|uniref:Putative Prolamin-like domain-containing protein n=1 Tax=Lupinus albus TaxID=3870 RepID=A0A6A5LTD9_LUPAL|nr:putative Prolamin-like domain-containing protein [Lupinus albus]KAF1863448.1 hypothetical protein Lal_00030480 [Lupinus albus]
MASFINFYQIITFMAIITLLVGNGESYFQILKSPKKPTSSDAPSPLSVDCASKLHPDCGTEIYFGVFFGNGTISEDCCYNLVHDLGRSCHDSMTAYALNNFPKFKPQEADILKRKDEVWVNCSH